VLIAENEENLRFMLTLPSDWCGVNGMVVNPIKSQIIQFRPNWQYVFNSHMLNIGNNSCKL